MRLKGASNQAPRKMLNAVGRRIAWSRRAFGALGGAFLCSLIGLETWGAEDFRPNDSVDHVTLLRRLGPEAYQLGERIYSNLCVNCHGQDGKTPSLPIARAFGVGPFKFGIDPYSLYRTLSEGNGLMGAQTWMSPEERYAVIHYIREAFMKENVDGYEPINETYLARFPAPDRAAPVKEASVGGRDFGGALSSQLRVGEGERIHDYPSVLTVRLSPDMSLAYDLHRMRQAAWWEGGFLDLSGTQHERPRGEFVPLIEGSLVEGGQGFGWVYHGEAGYGNHVQSSSSLLSPRGPLPEHLMIHRGYYLSDRGVVLSYRIEGREVIELPRAGEGFRGVVHSFRVAPGDRTLQLRVAEVSQGRQPFRSVSPGRDRVWVEAPLSIEGGVAVSREAAFDPTGEQENQWVAATVRGREGLQWATDEEGALILEIAASDQPRVFQLTRAVGQSAADFHSSLGAIQMITLRREPIIDPGGLRAGRQSRWGERISTSIEESPGEGDYPYSKDEIGLPEPNPWNAWMRTAALDFFADGTMAVSTHGGDIWLVSDLDSQRASWKRYAAGLYEPFGLKVVGDVIYITCKDRLVRLHDLNGDDEADFYESFYADWDVSMFFHAFNFDLERDAAGNFYYAKSGQYTDFRLPGAVIRVAPDGRTSEVMATGFRTPNGLGMLPDGRVTLGDNQGNWIPASKVSLIRPGRFYGYVNNLERPGRWAPDGGRLDLDRVPVPSTFEPPMIWMPQEVDSSCGGQVWVDDPRWGPLSGRMIHCSFGKARVFQLMVQEVGTRVQGALVKLPFEFQAGVQRARVNPADGQLYLVGLHGWNGGWPKERGLMQHGGVYRIRYNGTAAPLVLKAEVVAGGVRVELSQSVDRSRWSSEAAFSAEVWNYRWTRRYGSDQYSVLDPERRGRDQLVIGEVRLGPSGDSFELSMPELRPCHQLGLRLSVPTQNGGCLEEEILFTVNAIPQ